MAGAKFKPKASNNIIEGATPVDETEGKVTPTVEETEKTNTPEEGVVNIPEQETPAQETSDKETTETEAKTAPVKEDSEEKTTTQTVTFEDKKSTPMEKNVKICLKTKHSCNIGGVPYHFEKGKQYTVPQSVKSILMQADLLMPL